jgi:transaldolase / glucose-6-phosphate isomerase
VCTTADTAALDGYVSLEVGPDLAAHDADGTIAEAHRLWNAVNRPNLMIKVPGTIAGAEATRALIADGINVNVTLLFSGGRARPRDRGVPAGARSARRRRPRRSIASWPRWRASS